MSMVPILCTVPILGYILNRMYARFRNFNLNVVLSVRMKPEFLDRGPVGAIARATKTGWINEELFFEWFQHFLAQVQPKSRQRPTLLLADGHASHTKNLALIEKARENNVILLIFPSHCTHKLQPLDVAVFKSLKLNYDKEVSIIGPYASF